MNSLILRTAAGVLQPVLLLYSVYLLLAGHNNPGGGFAGGLVAAAAFALNALAYDSRSAQRSLQVDPRTLIGGGLVVATASGLPALVVGSEYLTGQWLDLPTPGGSIAVGTPLFFDVGVYLLVVGMVLLMVFPLAEE